MVWALVLATNTEQDWRLEAQIESQNSSSRQNMLKLFVVAAIIRTEQENPYGIAVGEMSKYKMFISCLKTRLALDCGFRL